MPTDIIFRKTVHGLLLNPLFNIALTMLFATNISFSYSHIPGIQFTDLHFERGAPSFNTSNNNVFQRKKGTCFSLIPTAILQA